MTQESIDRQIEVIRAVAAEVSVSKEAALEFLRSAGIKDTPEIVKSVNKTATKKRK